MIASGSSTLLLEDILDRVSEFDILSFYFKITHIPCVINSPLRKDKHPSFKLYSIDGYKIYFKDYATKQNGDTFSLLSLYFNLNFKETIQRIYNDLIGYISMGGPIKYLSKSSSKIYHKNIKLDVKIRDWKEWDILYWESYGISIPWANFGDIYPISHTIITKNNNKFIIPADKHAYVYVERKDNNISLKTYQPFSESYKWISKHDGSVWDLWQQLPQNANNLIITSSRKDALCIWENTKIPATGLQCESYLPKENVVQELKNRFKNIYVLYDNDFKKEENYGRINGKIFADTFGLQQIEIPNEYKCKDISDVAFNHGRKAIKEIIFNLITI